jgi:hypothetical protein
VPKPVEPPKEELKVEEKPVVKQQHQPKQPIEEEKKGEAPSIHQNPV